MEILVGPEMFIGMAKDFNSLFNGEGVEVKNEIRDYIRKTIANTKGDPKLVEDMHSGWKANGECVGLMPLWKMKYTAMILHAWGGIFLSIPEEQIPGQRWHQMGNRLVVLSDLLEQCMFR
jgi:hypothetical protein